MQTVGHNYHIIDLRNTHTGEVNIAVKKNHLPDTQRFRQQNKNFVHERLAYSKQLEISLKINR